MGKSNPYLNAAFMEVVDNQIAGNDPPETRETLNRPDIGGNLQAGRQELYGPCGWCRSLGYPEEQEGIQQGEICAKPEEFP